MKFYVSYFYAVRFMKPNTVALSTAKSDPQWFHQGWDKSVVYVDKNGVYNGLRAEPFVPQYFSDTEGFCGNCDKDQNHCKFMRFYRQQLEELDFDDMIKRFESIAQRVVTNGEEPEIVLLVHEAPDNPCSERWALLDWFKSHGIDAQEYPFHKQEKKKTKGIFLF